MHRLVATVLLRIKFTLVLYPAAPITSSAPRLEVDRALTRNPGLEDASNKVHIRR